MFGKGKIKGVSVIVPTMNSEARIGGLLSLLTRYFEEVVVGVDSKTTDGTKIAAQKYECLVISVENNDGQAVEEMVEKFIGKCRYDWVLRLDDDELISDKMAEFVRTRLGSIKTDCIGLHRKWCRVNKRGEWEWSGHPIYGFDWQYRLFRKDRVVLNKEIHTPGFLFNSFCYAPLEAFILHLDWAYNSYRKRQEKVLKYERIETGSGHREHYLYEEVPNYESFFIKLEEKNLDFVKCFGGENV